MITLSPPQLKDLLDETRKELVGTILADHGDALKLVSPSQAAGILDVTTTTLGRLPIPRVVIDAKRMVRYRLSDIRAFIEANLER
jgi:hypothetical protein